MLLGSILEQADSPRRGFTSVVTVTKVGYHPLMWTQKSKSDIQAPLLRLLQKGIVMRDGRIELWT